MSPRHRKVSRCSRCGQAIDYGWLAISRFTWSWGWRRHLVFCRKCSKVVQMLIDELLTL